MTKNKNGIAGAGLSVWFDKWKNLAIKVNLSGVEALRAVERDGYALRYIKEQTEAICLKAVEKNEYALRYVKEQMFLTV